MTGCQFLAANTHEIGMVSQSIYVDYEYQMDGEECSRQEETHANQQQTRVGQ